MQLIRRIQKKTTTGPRTDKGASHKVPVPLAVSMYNGRYRKKTRKQGSVALANRRRFVSNGLHI